MSNDAQSRSRVKTAEGTPEGVQVPNLSEVTRTKHRERTAEVARLAGVEPEPTAAPPATAERNFDAEIEALDPALRDHYQRKIAEGYNAALHEQYGDVMPLFMEAQKNPALRKNLVQFASEDELRNILADENAPKRLKRAADKQLAELYDNDDFRKFVADEALPIYRQYQPADQQATQAAPAAKSAELERLEALESRYNADRDAAARTTYVQNRIREYQALASKYPVLNENQTMTKQLLERAENDFVERARIAGINVDEDKNPGWPAQAMRAGIKPKAYHDVYNDYAAFNAVPAATSEAAPTGAVGDTRIQRPKAEPVAAGGRHTLTKEQLKERGMAALANFHKNHQKKGLTRG